MRTSILSFGLLVAGPAAVCAESPRWLTDYGAARERAAAEHKPLAVVFGRGADGWKQLGGTASTAVSHALAENYVCCHVDTATAAGQALAREFEMKGAVGLVISDLSGELQAFWHEGTLSAEALASRLQRYANPQYVATRTDVHQPVAPASHYPPPAPPAAPAPQAAPAMYAPPPYAPPAFAPAPASFAPAMGLSGPSFGGGACRT